MGVAILDDSVGAAQEIPVRARHFGSVQGVQNRLVVLVDQHYYRPSRLFMQCLQQPGEPTGSGGVRP